MPSPDLQRRRYKLVPLALATTILVGLGMLRFADLRSRREEILRAGDRRAENLTLILAGYIRQTLAAADASLRQLAAHSQRVGGPAASESAWLPILTSASAGLTGVGSISVVDRSGIVRQSNRPALLGQNRRDEYVYRQLSTNSADVLIASTPFKTYFTPNRPIVIPVGRRLTTADGAFDGVIVASFLPDSLRAFFRAVDVGRDGTVTMYHADGFVLFREPSSNDPIGETATGDPVFQHGIRSHAADRVVRSTSDGVQRRSAVTHLKDLPLIVAISLGEREVLLEWRRDVITSAVAFAALAGAVVIVLMFLSRQLDRRAIAEQAMGRAQRLDALGQLTGGVAHDFNNLLTVILGYVSLLKPDASNPSTALDAEALEAIDEIGKAGTRAADLTRQLLAFASRQPLNPRLVDLNDLVTSMQAMLARTLGEDVTLTLNLAANGCIARVDPVQVETAILNLCVNARDAMPKGGLLVIETGRADLDAEYAQLSVDVTAGAYSMIAVSDSGVGIPPEVLPRLFEPFFTTKAPGKGTGLGLSMVYGFVKQSGGHVRVYSEVGHGTVVKMYFREERRAVAAASGEPEKAVPRGAGEVVMLVEDDPAVRVLASRMLKELGYRVVEATDGPSALDVAGRESRIDLLFTDVVLPGSMNGHALAEELGRRRPGLSVLYTSGYSLELIKHRTDANESLRLLTKPYERVRLAEAVRGALRGRGEFHPSSRGSTQG